jgi:hypothetical protein
LQTYWPTACQASDASSEKATYQPVTEEALQVLILGTQFPKIAVQSTSQTRKFANNCFRRSCLSPCGL